MMRGPGCAAGESGPSGGDGISALMSWCPKPTTLSGAHVAADHAVGQTRLKRLVYDTSVGREITLAACHELGQWKFFEQAAAAPFQNAHKACLAGRRGHQLDPPNPDTAIAAVPLDDPRSRRLQPRGECGGKFARRAVELGIGSPPEISRPVQDLFDTHLEDHVGVRTDTGPARCDITEHRIELRAVLPLMDRIEPYEHAIDRHELPAWRMSAMALIGCAGLSANSLVVVG
jgi:hypothetical protein